MDQDPRKQADESVALRFTRVMNASTSPYGVLCDMSLAAAVSAVPLIMVVRQVSGGDLTSPLTVALIALTLAPAVVSLGAGLALRGARASVVDWIASQPFPIDNMNGLLAGTSDAFEISFRPGSPPPTREAIQALLDPVSDDSLAMLVADDEPRAEVKIGVIDSRRVPIQTNHRRYVRFQQLVERALLPLHREHPIAGVRLV